jgi:hypothetical protein
MMADEIVNQVPVEASVAAEPVVAPVAEAPAVAAPVESVAAEAPVAAPSLLETFDAENKPAEVVAEPAKEAATEAPKGGEKPADGAPVAEVPALEPVDYKYTLPETMKMDDTLKGDVHKAFDAFRANPSEGAQALVDIYTKATSEFAKNYAEDLTRKQWDTFAETRRGWQTEVMADPEIGGAGFQTSMGAIARVRDALVPPSEREAFETMLRVTGVGDHPQFLKMLHRGARFIDEAPQPPQNIKPPTGNGRKPVSSLKDLY